MYTVWHVDKYKITFKLVINHWTNEILVTDICYICVCVLLLVHIWCLTAVFLNLCETAVR